MAPGQKAPRTVSAWSEPTAKTINREIERWRTEAREANSDAWLIAIGIAYGLTIARDQWMKPRGNVE